MSRLFRWQTIVPRLMLVALALLAVQYVLGLLARSIVLRSGEPAVAARVQSSRAHVSLLKRQLVLDDLRIESVDQPSRALVEIDRCALAFAAKPLLYKQAVVDHGTVTGVRFGDLRFHADSPNRAGMNSASSARWLGNDAAEKAGEWLQRVGRLFENDLVTQLESVRRTEELCTRWPRESAAIQERCNELKQRAATLQSDVQAAQANPLRHVEFLNDLPDTVAALDKDFAQLAADSQTFLDSFEADRRAIVASRTRDASLVSHELRLEPIDAGALTAYLLREEVDTPLNEVIGWLRGIRHAVPANASCSCQPSRGANVVFAGCRPSPSLLIRDLRLQGDARIGGQAVELLGILTDFTSAPARHPKPIRLRLKSIGSTPLTLQATIDRTTPVPRDELLVDCGGIVLPKIDLGQNDQLGMSLEPSVGSLSISVSVQGEDLAGDIQLVQKQVQMTPALGGELRHAPLAAPLKETLGKLESLAMRVSLSGTLQEPKYTLWSNLGPAVAEGMERALKHSADQHARSLLARAQKLVDERLAGIERQAAEQHAQVAALRTRATADLAKFAGQQATGERLSREQLGRQLPAGSLFR